MLDHHRVTLDDVDAAGVVFAPTIVALAHRGYERAALARGLDLAAVVRARALALPLVRIEADFARPLRHGDQLELRVACARVGDASYAMRIEIALDGMVAATITQAHACVDLATGRATPLPAAIRGVLETWG